MLKLELKRSINNKIYLIAIFSCILSFILGYILLISIDKEDLISLQMLQFSTYMVYTQFGFLIFPVIVAFMINNDYKSKNILFYKAFKINFLTYFIEKILIIGLWFSIGTLTSLFIASIIYQDFSNFLTVFLSYELVIIYIILVSGAFAFLFENILVAFCINLFVWIAGIVLATIAPVFKYVSYFDAALPHHESFEVFLKSGDKSHLTIGADLIYIVSVLFVVLVIINLFKKRWKSNGI